MHSLQRMMGRLLVECWADQGIGGLWCRGTAEGCGEGGEGVVVVLVTAGAARKKVVVGCVRSRDAILICGKEKSLR